MIRVAVPCDGSRTIAHFGRAPTFAFLDVDPDTRKIVHEEIIAAPPHERGVFPSWIAERGAQVVLAPGMGHRARQRFRQYRITVVVGIKPGELRQTVMDYLNGTPASGGNICDHGGPEHRPDCR